MTNYTEQKKHYMTSSHSFPVCGARPSVLKSTNRKNNVTCLRCLHYIKNNYGGK